MGCILETFCTEKPSDERHPIKYSRIGSFMPSFTTSNKNMLFFKNEIRSEPDGDVIDEIHARWYYNYQKLESHHGYIQWLFPLKEEGVNWRAQRLTADEIEFITNDPAAQRRLLTSYRMMTNFYGMELVDESTGELKRTDNWQERMSNLNRMTHNNQRITRILKSLRLLGLEHLNSPFVHFFAHEIFEEGTLPATRNSCLHFWIPVLSPSEQARVIEYIRSTQTPQRDHD